LVASSKSVEKVYEVKVKGLPNENAINKLRRGIRLDDGFKTAPAEIKELKHTENNGWYEVTLLEGHNQQIRKMFDAIGHSGRETAPPFHRTRQRRPHRGRRVSAARRDEVKKVYKPAPKNSARKNNLSKRAMFDHQARIPARL
jgi:23S rRNA pseudouridine2605 synthase